MTAISTLSTPEFDGDTYRSNEASREAALKFRIATETTGETATDSEDVVTKNLDALFQYRLTSQFRRQVLERALVVPNVIDNIKQKFSGFVTEVDHESKEFSARITDVTHPKNPEEQVTLSFDEIQEVDQNQLEKGDSFVWYIGYVQGQMISREGFSKIHFRRLPVWSQQEIDTASSQAEELASFFNRDPDRSP
ncbi:hypothetical protein BMS3Abin11_02275 [bacterium BMS3Abin11]|nr:hypothetical protein BMS3Abin11_02275 [bacterium BMS3Abin11]